jgi:arylsulfatase
MPPARRRDLLAASLGLGLAWYGTELAFALASAPGSQSGALLERFVAFLPWQLATFCAIGLGLALWGSLRPLSLDAAVWFALGVAVVLFLGSRVVEGALHVRTAGVAAGRLLGVAGGTAIVLGALAALERRVPGRVRRPWAVAVWAAISVGCVGFLRRAGAGLGLGEVALRDLLDHASSVELSAAAITGALLLVPLLSFRRRAALIAAATCTPWILPAPPAAAGPPPDVYVFLIDTLRHDHLAAAPEGKGPTPELARIAPEFYRFRNAFSPSTRTSRSMPGIMTSLSVRVVGASLPAEAVTLAERLAEAGYSTRGISANPLVSATFGYEQGFDELVDVAGAPDILVLPLLKLASALFPAQTYRLGVARADLFYPPIDQLRRRALDVIEASPPPTFLYVQTMDVHGPYLPPRRLLPDEYRHGDFLSYYAFLRLSRDEVLADGEMPARLSNLRQRYAAGVRFTDEQLAATIAELRARARWDEAIVWILSDHGEAFGEHGYAGHGQAYLGRAVTQVPLWLKLPRSHGGKPREIEAAVSSYDVLPTTLSLLGLPPVAPSFGRDLTPLLREGAREAPRTIFIETDRGARSALYAAVRFPWKLELDFAEDAPQARRLYHLDVDPGETADVAAQHPGVADALQREIVEHRRQEETLSLRRRKAAVDANTRERLRSLGYVD